MKKSVSVWMPATTVKTGTSTRHARAGYGVKSFCAALLVVAMCLGLTACGGSSLEKDAKKMAKEMFETYKQQWDFENSGQKELLGQLAIKQYKSGLSSSEQATYETLNAEHTKIKTADKKVRREFREKIENLSEEEKEKFIEIVDTEYIRLGHEYQAKNQKNEE